MNIILLSGGSGKRLWPLSNDVRSKQFIKLFKNNDEYESMVQRVYRQVTTVDADAKITREMILVGNIVQKSMLKKYSSKKQLKAIGYHQIMKNCPSPVLVFPYTLYCKGICFDENFGVGATFGACEETDLILEALDNKYQIRRFDDLLNAPYMMAYERPNRNGIEAGCFGAEAGNPFISDCLKYYEGRHFVKSDGTFDKMPLPLIMKDCLVRGGFEYNLFDWDYFTAKSYETGEEKITTNTYCVHHFAGTWKTESEIKIIKNTQRLQKYFGYKVARNIAEYVDTYSSQKLKGIVQLTCEKIGRKKKDKSE